MDESDLAASSDEQVVLRVCSTASDHNDEDADDVHADVETDAEVAGIWCEIADEQSRSETASVANDASENVSSGDRGGIQCVNTSAEQTPRRSQDSPSSPAVRSLNAGADSPSHDVDHTSCADDVKHPVDAALIEQAVAGNACADSIGEFCDTVSTDSSQQCHYDEPYLKYERMGADMALLLAHEAATCLTVHERVIVVGTAGGRVHVFDHLGNRVRAPLLSHSMSVNQVCVDLAAEFIGSCSDDGGVAVLVLCSSSSTTRPTVTGESGRSACDDAGQCHMTLDCPVKAMALDPQYQRGGSRRRVVVAASDARLVLYERSFLSRLKTTVIHEGERGATVEAMRWQARLLVWASTSGQVRVLHVDSRRLVSVVLVEAGPRPQHYRCHLFWTDQCRQLLIGWKNCAQVARLCDSKGVVRTATGHSGDCAGWYMEIIHIFHTDFIVCGVSANIDGSRLFLLSQQEEDTGRNGAAEKTASSAWRRPQMRVIRPLSADYEELSADELAVRGCEQCTCRQYHVESLVDEGVLLLLAPSDLLVARPRDTDDHLDWLLEQEQYEEALHQLRQSRPSAVKRHSVQDVGRRYLDSLLQQEQYETAASLCQSIFGKNRTLWEEEVFRFASLRQLKAISCYLPRGDFRLHSTVYEMVLYSFLRTDAAEFLRLLKDWCPSLYHCNAVINGALEQLLHEPDNPHLLEALGLLYTLQNRHDKALVVYLKLGHRCVFQLVRDHQLHALLSGRVAALIDIDATRAVELLTDRPDLIECDVVVAEVTAVAAANTTSTAATASQPPVLFSYLRRLCQRQPQLSRKYHDLLVQLYADHEPHHLLDFLRASGSYSLQHALSVCRSRCRVPETVYLLGRMGSTSEALQLIMLELADIGRAIEFCKEHSDVDLWDQLITLCLDQPVMIKQLLLNIGTHVDPQRLLRRVPASLVIPGLRDALVQMLHDYKMQLVMQRHCRNTLVDDYFQLHRQMAAAANCGVLVAADGGGGVCVVCSHSVFSTDTSPPSPVDTVVFHCGHVCHQKCLATSLSSSGVARQQKNINCPACENTNTTLR